MARAQAAAAAAAPAADVTASILLIATGDIDPGTRLRPVDPVWADALGKVMLRDGQFTPIEVCRLPGTSRWTLVAGAHRLAGAQSAGIATLRAIEVTNDKAERRLREVSENLWRSGLAPVDRAAFIAELVELQKVRDGVDPSKDGRAASAAVRWQNQVKDDAEDAKLTMSLAYGWNDAVAETLGVSVATVKRDMLLYRRLKPSAIERLREARHPLLGNAGQLAALAKLGEIQQSLALDMLIDGTAKSVSDAMAIMAQKPKQSPKDKRWNAFIGAWSRMELAEKKAAIAQLLAMAPQSIRAVAHQELQKGEI